MTRSPTPSRRICSSAWLTLMLASRSGKSFRACSATGDSKSGRPAGSFILFLYAMNDAFAPQKFFGLGEIIAHIGLRADPVDVTPDAFSEVHLWFIPGGANALRSAR